MPNYTVTDPQSGKTATLTGDSPPTEQELNDVFSQIGTVHDSVAQPEQSSARMPIIGQTGPTGPGGYAADSGNQPNPAIGNALFSNQPTGFAGGLLRGAPAAIGGAIAGPAGAMAGEALRQAGVNAAAVSNNADATSPLGVVGNVGLAGATQYVSELAAPYVQAGVSKISGVLGDAAQGIAKYAGINLAGVKPGAYALAQESPQGVSKYLGASPEVGDALAQRVRDSISATVSNGEAQYPALIEAAKKNPAYAGKTFDLESALGQKIRDIAEQHSYGTGSIAAQSSGARQSINSLSDTLSALGGSPERDLSGILPLSETPSPAIARASTSIVQQGESFPGANEFWRFANKIKNLGNPPDVMNTTGTGATLDQVYAYQRQLNGLAQDSAGKPLGVAFGKLKNAVRDYLGSEIPEIGQANASYAAAKALDDQTGKLTNANDLINFVSKAYQNPHDTLTKQALEDAASKVPGLGDALNEIQHYAAAKSFEPLIRGIPATGYGAAAIYGAGAGAHSAINAIGGGGLTEVGAGLLAAAGALLSSPRLALATLRASEAAGPSLAKAAQSAAIGAGAATPAIAQAFAHMSPQSLAAYYRSPGNP